MACFTVSAAAGIGVAIARHIVKHHEKKLELNGEVKEPIKFGSDIKWSKKLAYLELGLFAGSAVLGVEHIIHGEVTPFPPFLTSAADAASAKEMLVEMGTVGVAMLGILVAAWAIGVLVADYIKFRKRKKVIALKEVEAK